MILLLTVLVAFALSWTLVRLARTVALRRGLLDLPNDRSSHVRPTPRVGGLGILGATLVAGVGGAASLSVLTPQAWAVLVLAGIVALVSLIDDLRGLPPLSRLGVHLCAGVTAVAAVGPLGIGLAGDSLLVAAAPAITVLWVAGFINAFNFMDGTDGIAAGQAIVAAATWSMIGWFASAPLLTCLAGVVAAATFGFLLHNRPPASIFMGDVGSALLGSLLATLPLLLDPPPSLLVAVLPVWPFVFDTALTLLRRARRGENLLAAHRSHLYQRLNQNGWPHGRIAILYAGLAFAGSLVAVAMADGRLHSPLPAVTVVALGSAALWTLTVMQEARHQRGVSQTRAARTSDDA